MSASSRAKQRNVKAHGPKGRGAKGFSRHFEGWQPALLAAFLAVSSAIVTLPHSVDPVELPEPMLSPSALDRVARADDALAARAEAEGALAFDVRALGSAIRAYGQADADEADDVTITALRKRVAEAASAARAQGEEPLAKLRAYQQRAFLRALRHWESKGEELPELRELGGAFVAMAGRNGWFEDGRLVIDESVRRALFKKRWNELTLLRGPRFDLDLAEQRALLRFLLRHPPRTEVEASAAGPRPRGVKENERAAFAAGQYRMRKIEELAAVDRDYPADLARGVVLFELHRYGAATEMFRRHLDAQPEGPFALRARNHLDASLRRANEETP